ncbi:MAG: hypothetical protein IJW50_11250 [Clostridia bacterium]|nr:hypothetical protein [Clostridia bacterium]MBQ9798281.1 hypothetical protein [Clostridia bacterium]
MFTVELAGVRIGIDNRYAFVEEQCRAFTVPDGEVAFTVSVTEEEIREEASGGDFSDGYCESICVYRNICEQIAEHNVFLMHASVIEVDGYAYAFAAKSGVGKSTHTSLWLKNVPHARVLNGDKPLMRWETDGSITAFGTPWNGKEGWGENISAPLAAVCFLERGAQNSIRHAGEDEILTRLMHQLYLRGERTSVEKRLQLMDRLVTSVPYYVLTCTISDEAARIAYGAMCPTKC